MGQEYLKMHNIQYRVPCKKMFRPLDTAHFNMSSVEIWRQSCGEKKYVKGKKILSIISHILTLTNVISHGTVYVH